MNVYFRQCYYKSKERHCIFIDPPYMLAETEEEALADLLEKYIDNEDIVCWAKFIREVKLENIET